MPHEGCCPREAVRAFLRQEHRYYDIIGGYGRVTHVPLPVPVGVRTEEGKAQRANAIEPGGASMGPSTGLSARRREGRALAGSSTGHVRHEHPLDRCVDLLMADPG